MAITSSTKEGMIQQVAENVVAKAAKGEKPEITFGELETIARDLGWTCKDIKDFTAYTKSPEGRESFKRAVRLELWKAGYRPKE